MDFWPTFWNNFLPLLLRELHLLLLLAQALYQLPVLVFAEIKRLRCIDRYSSESRVKRGEIS